MSKALDHLKYRLANAKNVQCDIARTCTLECPACLRQVYKKMGKSNNRGQRDLTVEDFTKILDWYDDFGFVGQVSDAILNPYLDQILKICYDNNKTVYVNTSATAKNRGIDWYRKCFDANPVAKWTFGIDGIEDKSEWYRINQDTDLLWEAMFMAKRDYPDRIVSWQYIIFSFNENDIKEAYSIAQEHGILFKLQTTSRFGRDEFKPKNPKYLRD